MKVWQDGKWRSSGVQEELIGTPALQFGFGLFETILVQNGRAIDLEDHFQRLARSIAQLDAVSHCSLDIQQLRETVLLSLRQCEEEKEVLKIIAYRSETQWGTLLLLRSYPYARQDYERGFSLRLSESFRNARSLLVHHKTLNYLENYLERQKARHDGYDEAFFLNTEGIVTECTAANLFILSKGELLTAPVQAGLLPGITRMKLLGRASTIGLAVKEIPICKTMLWEADMVLITNALYGVMPVAKIEDRCYTFDLSLIEKMNKALNQSI